MSENKLEVKNDKPRFCFYERFRITVDNILNHEKIRFEEMSKLAHKFANDDWNGFKELLEKEQDPDKYGLLGDLISSGRRLGLFDDFEKSIELFQKGVSLGSGYSAACLGVAYERGKGVDVNIEKALENFQQGIEMGCGIAAVYYGTCLLKKHGLEQVKEEYIELLVKGILLGCEKTGKEVLERVLRKIDNISDEILDMISHIDGLPPKVEVLVLKRKVEKQEKELEKLEKTERELKRLQLERSNAGKVLGRNLCGVISDFI